MPTINMRKIYNFHPVEPAPDPALLPIGADLYYECLDCAAVVNSVPYIKVDCACGNLQGAAGQLAVKNPAQVRVVRGQLK